METLEPFLHDLVGIACCIEPDDGRVVEYIRKALRAGKQVVLSFQNVEMKTSAFLNTIFGQLYRDFPEDAIKEKLTITQMEAPDLALLKRTVNTAKLLHRDPERLREYIDEVMES